MGAYYLDNQGQIYADVAYRLGVIVKQYDSIIAKNHEQNFDSTMSISFLQNLLTIYSEFWKNESYGIPPFWLDPFYHCKTSISENNYFGIEPTMLLENNFVRENQTISTFLTHIRNALSHPTSVATDGGIQSTGYYSLFDQFGRISNYVFIDSPDVKVNNNGTNRPKSFNSLALFNNYKENHQMRKHPFKYEEVNGKIELRNHRIYKVCLSVDQLKKLVIDLSKLIAQPIQKNWNGNDFNLNILDHAA